MEVAVVRYGELGLKSDRVRRRMERALMENIERQTGGKTFKRAARILVVGGDWEELSYIFGVKSWSPAVEIRADIEEMKEVAVELVKGAKSFRISAQRVTKDFPLTSPEINKIVGAHVVEALGTRVNLKNPEVDVGIEIIGRKAYVFTERHPGPGGLPVGVEGDLVLLFSGGIDSPVAGWMVGKRGVRIHPLHLHMGVDPSGILRKLARWFPGGLNLRVEPFPRDKILEVVQRRKKTSYFFLLVKAVLYRAAEEYAEDIGALGIVTGESIGQVASQTLHNLSILSKVVKIPVFRPLLGLNKEEVVDLAKRIGTYEESIRLPEPCARIPFKPVTQGRLDILLSLLEEVIE